MAAENAEYERVLGELNTVCNDIVDLCGQMNLDKIKKDLQVVSQKSKEQMETLKRLKFEIESLHERNKILEAENTMLKLNVERIVINKDGKGGEGEGGEGEGGEGEGEGGEGEGEGGEGEGGEGEDESEEEEDEYGSLIWKANANQIQMIVDYIGENFFINNENSLRLRFRYKDSSTKGFDLNPKNFTNSIQVIVQKFSEQELHPFVLQPGSKFNTAIKDLDDKSVWQEYRRILENYLKSEEGMSAMKPPIL